MDLKTKFIFLLGMMLIVLSSLVYAQELRVLGHIPAEDIESSLYKAAAAGVAGYPVLGGWNLAVSPNGRFIGFWSAKNLSIKVMDLETKEIIAELNDLDLKDLKRFTLTPIWSLTFTPNNRYLAIVLDKPPMVKLWEFTRPSFVLKQTDTQKPKEEKETPQKVINLQLPDIDEEDWTAKKEPTQIAFSLDGRYLATSVVTKIYLWDTTNWQVITTFKSPIPYGEDRPGGGRSITRLVFSPDTKYLVSRCGSQLSVWELYVKVETEEWKAWDRRATDCEVDLIAKNFAAGPRILSPLEQKELEKELEKCRENEPTHYVDIFNPHLFLPDIRSPHRVGNISMGDLVFSADGRYLITNMLRFDFTPEEWKAQIENAKKLGLELKPEDVTANFERFAGQGAAYPIAIYGDLVAVGAPNNQREPAKIFSLSELRELISFNTVRDKNSPDMTHLIFFFPDGKRLLTYNNLEGIYIFDISDLKN